MEVEEGQELTVDVVDVKPLARQGREEQLDGNSYL